MRVIQFLWLICTRAMTIDPRKAPRKKDRAHQRKVKGIHLLTFQSVLFVWLRRFDKSVCLRGRGTGSSILTVCTLQVFIPVLSLRREVDPGIDPILPEPLLKVDCGISSGNIAVQHQMYGSYLRMVLKIGLNWEVGQTSQCQIISTFHGILARQQQE